MAVGAAAIAVALAVTAASSGASRPTVVASPGGSASAEPVSEADYCFVESMIFYRVEAAGISGVLLDTDAVSSPTRALAADLVAHQQAELDDLREWYVSWADARPLERPDQGPCAGHGAHADMPGVPTWQQRTELADATGAQAEALYLALMRAQVAGVADLAATTLAGDPNSLVRVAAEQAVAEGERDAAALAARADALP